MSGARIWTTKTKMRVVEDESAAGGEDPLQRMLRLAGIDRSRTVSVAGPGGLEIMVALCRAGWDRVECALQATCLGADESSDLLILAGPGDKFGALTARTAGLLRDGGIIAANLEDLSQD